MKTIIIIAFLIGFSSCLLYSQENDFHKDSISKVSIIVNGLKNNKGVVRVFLFKGTDETARKKYPNEKFCNQSRCVTIVKKSATLVFDSLSYGSYAFYLHHDENNDNTMNSNFIGMPAEGYAFSNNSKPGMKGLPNFKSARFNIDLPVKVINVKVRN